MNTTLFLLLLVGCTIETPIGTTALGRNQVARVPPAPSNHVPLAKEAP